MPAIISWPGNLDAAKVPDAISVCDIFPTLAHIAGIDMGEYPEVEGINISPAFEGRALPEDRVIYWRTPQGMAVRKGGWKIIHSGKTPSDGTTELYDLSGDPYEKHDLASENNAQLEEMKAELARNFSLD